MLKGSSLPLTPWQSSAMLRGLRGLPFLQVVIQPAFRSFGSAPAIQALGRVLRPTNSEKAIATLVFKELWLHQAVALDERNLSLRCHCG